MASWHCVNGIPTREFTTMTGEGHHVSRKRANRMVIYFEFHTNSARCSTFCNLDDKDLQKPAVHSSMTSSLGRSPCCFVTITVRRESTINITIDVSMKLKAFTLVCNPLFHGTTVPTSSTEARTSRRCRRLQTDLSRDVSVCGAGACL